MVLVPSRPFKMPRQDAYLGPALVAEPNVSLMADTVSTPDGDDRLQPLRSKRSSCA